MIRALQYVIVCETHYAVSALQRLILVILLLEKREIVRSKKRYVNSFL